MSNTTLQGIVSGAMVDGKIYIDFGDFHIAHGAVTGDIELTIIVDSSFQKCSLGVGFIGCSGSNCFVVGNCQFLCFKQGAVVCLLDDFLISSLDFRCILFINIVADDRIKGHPQCQQKYDDSQDYGDYLVFRINPSFRENPEGDNPLRASVN